MMKLALLLLALCSSLAAARIGETPAECAKRYGKEIKPGLYAKDGITIDVWFHEGRCVALRFMLEKPDMIKDPLSGDQEAFPRAAQAKLLEANSGGSAWTSPAEVEYLTTMVTADGSRRASFGPTWVTIQLVSDIERRKKLLTPEAINKTTEGF